MIERVQQDDVDLEVVLARWVLGELAPERVPDIAVLALECGCEAPSVAVLAGLHAPIRREVEDELIDVLLGTGLSRPTATRALKVMVDQCARRIVAGSVAPFEGAREIWRRAPDSTLDFVLWEQFRPFIGLASEWEDHEVSRPLYEAQIVAAAELLLSGGGLKTFED